MGVPGNLYITTTCIAFLPLDGSLKSSTVVIMYANLQQNKGDFMRLADSNGISATDATDAVIISTRDGNSIFLSEFLSMYEFFNRVPIVAINCASRDKMIQKFLTHKSEFDRRMETISPTSSRTVYSSKHRQQNVSQ
jgi:alpha-D-ribose 1-methylphosphonate 5-triphosphate synthase subunit PhnL